MSLYARFGDWLYHTGNKTEAKLYGLVKKVVSIHDLEQHVWVSGNSHKPALLFVHGFSASHAVWLRLAKHFTKDYFVIIPDLAGHGDTCFKQTQSYDMGSQSERLCFLLDALGVEKAHIVGNSMGGFMAATMARFHEERCLSITLIDPAGIQSPEPSDMEIQLSQGNNPFIIHNHDEFKRFFAMTMASPPFLPKVVLAGVSQHYQARAKELEKIFFDYNNKEDYLDNELHFINVPSYVMWGKQDRLIHSSAAAVWQSKLQCDGIVWDDLGHMPMLEAPKRTAQALRAFLASV